jgi:hypothetical protein
LVCSLCSSFFIASVIDRSEILGDSSDDSKSFIDMFTIPPIACQQVQGQQERPSSTSTTNTRRSTSTANTSQSTSTANTSKGTTTNAPQRRSALGGFVFMGNGRTGIQRANHAAEIIRLLQLAGAHPANTSRSTSTANTSKGTTTNATQRRSALGGFVFTGNGRTGIRLANHAAEIIKLLQLAGAHPSRWEGTLGHNNWTPWFHENVNAIFQADSPLGMFNQVSLLVLL